MADFTEEMLDPEMEMLALKRQAQSALQQFRMAELDQDVQRMVQDRLEKLGKEVDGLDKGQGTGGTRKTSVTPQSRNPQGAPSMAQGGAEPALIQQLLAAQLQGLG